jgi:glucose 1-dehydrogenase
MTMGPLTGQVALVTGAGSGIGLEVAARLARDGAAVACNGQDRRELAEVVARIVASGGRAIAVVGDVSSDDDVRRVVAEADDALGGLHIVVNNAGLQKETPFLELELADWRAQLAVDLDGAFLVALHACRLMAQRGGGVVINVTSVHEMQPRPGFAAYCAAKAGLGMLTKVMARELASVGIRAVAVAPGAVVTPIQGEQTERERRVQEEGIPMGRLGMPEEIAGLIAWLAGPAAAYVSGTTFVMDGTLMTQVSLS